MAAPVRNEFNSNSLEGVMSQGCSRDNISNFSLNILQYLSDSDIKSVKGTSFALRNVVSLYESSFYQMKLEAILKTSSDVLDSAIFFFRKENPGAPLEYKKIFQFSCDFLFELLHRPSGPFQKRGTPKHFYSFKNLEMMQKQDNNPRPLDE